VLLDDEIDEYLEERLLKEIEPLLPDEKEQVKPSVSHQMAQEPKNVQEKFAEAKTLFKEMKEARLGIFSDKKEVRAAAAIKVIELARLNKECWLDIDHYRKFGYLPSAVSTSDTIAAMNVTDLFSFIKRTENYIYKFGKKAKSLSGNDKKELEERIRVRENELAIARKKLELYDA
jgi:hypothetical protein